MSGAIDHDPDDDGYIDVYSADVWLADGIIEARFINPYSTRQRQGQGWCYGFLLRRSVDGIHAVLVSNHGWRHHLYLKGASDWIRLAGEGSDNIDTGPYGSNHIRVIALGAEGTLLLNGHYVATLDLGGHMEAGEVRAIGAGFYTNCTIAGKVTWFEDFMIRPLD